MADTTTPKKTGPRLQHVVAHQPANGPADVFDDVLVFGQELDALRHTHGKTGWVYVAVAHGQSVKDARKAAQS